MPGIGLRCLVLSIDTTTPEGQLLYSIFDHGVFADFDREFIRECTQAPFFAALMRGEKRGAKEGPTALWNDENSTGALPGHG